MLSIVLWLPMAAAAGTLVTLPWPRPLGPADALTTVAFRAVVEDRGGCLWFASDDGLFRFDGHRFRAWQREEGLPEMDLRALHVDAHDQLWIATATQGLAMLPADRSGIHDVPGSGAVRLPPSGIVQITSTSDGVVWVGTLDDGLFARRPDGRWQVIRLQQRGSDVHQVNALATDHSGRLWVGTPGGALRREGDRFIELSLPSGERGGVQSLWPDPEGGVWARTPGGVHRWNSDGVLLPMSPRQDMPLLRSTHGEMWSAGPTGLFRHRDGQVPQPVPLRGHDGATLTSAAIRHALEDRNGGMWWIGQRQGLWHLPARWRQFTLLRTARDGGPRLAGDHVLALAPSRDQRLWVADDSGRVQRVDLGTGRSDIGFDYRPEHLRSDAVGVAEDRRGQLWVARGNTLSRYLPGTGRQRHWLLGGDTGTGPIDLQACRDGSLWLARADRIQRRDADGVLQLSATPYTLGLVPPTHGPQVLCTDDGLLWATDRDGIKRWLPAQERFASVDGAPRGVVGAIARGQDGHYWISSAGMLGRYRWDGQQLRRTHGFGAAQGYPQVLARALLVDAHGIAWAGDPRGLIRVDPHGGGVHRFAGDDGLPAHEVLPRLLVRTDGDHAVAATREGGLLLFDPALVLPAAPAPGLVIHAITVRRGGARISLPVSTGPVLLSHADRHIRVAAGPPGGGPASMAYRFRLQGHDAEWQDGGAVGRHVLQRVPAGLQTLEVQARLEEGGWSPIHRVALQVAPAWWQTPPVRWSAAAAAIGAVWLGGAGYQAWRGRQWRWRWLWARYQHAERASLQRTRLLTTLGARIRVPMTAVLGWSELLLRTPLAPEQRARVDCLHYAGQHLLRLADDALDMACIEAGRLQLQPAPFALQQLVDDLHALLLPVAQARSLVLECHSTLPASAVFLGDAPRMRQILLNLLGNALKFTACGSVRLEAQPGNTGEGVLLRVRDTGPGMTAAQCERLFQRFEQAEGMQTAARYGGSGLGLSISRELALAMGGDITVTSRPGEGACFQVQLPLPRVLATGTAPRRAREEPCAGGPLRVLVVCPVATVAQLVQAMLASLGHRAMLVPALDGMPGTAGDGACWDVIVVDPALWIDGERAGARVARCWPGIPRVALSACADARAQREATAAGFNVFLRLPLNRAALADGLDRCRRHV